MNSIADRAGVERGLAILLGALVQQPATAQPGHGSVPRATDDRFEILARRRRRGVKLHARVHVAREHAIEDDEVEVHVEVHASESRRRSCGG